ncbi:RNA polymerase sigma-70 factor [Fulvivirgaceae bacterium BMA10]|uniref:RNA polymerase sigma-70 factor n=1 Tax=Splendidivirga corallicola TaxID=3051826 RepID=A0ABT8KU35_9BACT|nr:RNA polymerase sigma-70 factor [Fulvivirgaceae bacterium BMA10]
MTKVISSEEFVIERVKQGDALAFEELFNKYYKKLKQFTYKITKSDYLAEEITQEAFVSIWINRDKIDPALSFNGYIYRVTRNLAINHLKKIARSEKARNEFWDNIEKAKNDISERVIHGEYSQCFEEAIKKLPKQKQLIFKLSREEGKSHNEIAKELGISRNTVKNHMVTALKTIKNYLQVHADISLPIVGSFLSIIL